MDVIAAALRAHVDYVVVGRVARNPYLDILTRLGEATTFSDLESESRTLGGVVVTASRTTIG